ncbi:LacI family DNA-binding transcriptional regulator [Planosporangium mesophilum]|uniref:Transcriptional regulator n=1 Tax=Planosporangium mesophilum TaxID=689768 RepID=A0A8J3TFK0_9ACTN|nr:LacI family DNA-binding transcriptional regulator [Planosporangium mesophilum]NJC85504.1 LacI family transcriptional regulator [Planosporangium mesophilum]GII24631.1 transcriptional regulator [Planosporangium mesophilum]
MSASADHAHGAPRPRRAVTIARIAERAGVSVPTVSKVINGRSDVAAGTRERVEAIIREYGYQRPEKAVSTAPLLELIFHELESAWAIEIIRGVEEVAREADLAVVLSELQGRHTPRRGWIEGVLARRPTGVISVFSGLSPEQRSQLDSRGVPFVVVDPTGEPGHGTPSIGATNWSGGLSATRHLLDLGHRRIAVISGPDRVLCSRARLDGYRAAMDAAGLPVERDLIRTGDFHVEAGFAQARALLALPDPPTAIFAGSDLQALGVYEAAREAGLRIPDDLSVVGFDDLPVARWVGPPLTTVRQPLVEMAGAAVRLVLALARGERPEQTRLELSTSMVVRQSTAPPRER